MDLLSIIAILELISKAIKIGGELLPVALRAYAALKKESGMSDKELIAETRKLNTEDAAKLQNFLAETAPSPP